MAEEEVHVKNDKNKPIFCELSANELESEITKVDSLCTECGKDGITKLLFTKIPYYKDVMLISFDCEHCGHKNNEIQSSGKVNDRGIKIKLQVKSPQDLNRQVVKSDYTSILIPHLDFEIPAHSQKGEITTVEGIIDRSINGLEQDQPRRQEVSPDTASAIDQFIKKLHALKIPEEPFTIILQDISGKSHVENPKAPLKDHGCTVTYFKRTKEQNHMLGFYEDHDDYLLKPIEEGEYTLEQFEGEIMAFPTNCPDCNNPCETNMKLTRIPHFKEVVIMATLCEYCGHRTNEIKSSGGIESKGVRIEVTVTGKGDFSRDLLKSETCDMEIPELDLQVGPAALGGRFTTVEGIIMAIKDQLSTSTAFTGDTNDSETINRMETFLATLEEVLQGEKKITLILDDPAGNSYVQSLCDDEPDDRLKITKYDRSFEQNDDLGLNDMKVDNY